MTRRARLDADRTATPMSEIRRGFTSSREGTISATGDYEYNELPTRPLCARKTCRHYLASHGSQFSAGCIVPGCECLVYLEVQP